MSSTTNETGKSPVASSSSRPSTQCSTRHIFQGTQGFLNGELQMLLVMYPALLPGSTLVQRQEHTHNGAGLYCAPRMPYMGTLLGFKLTILYVLPTVHQPSPVHILEISTRGNSKCKLVNKSSSVDPKTGCCKEIPFRIPARFAAYIKAGSCYFLFDQDGSRKTLAVLVFFASLVYLCQTGALVSLVRWLSRGMQRAAAPPHPPRPVGRAENVPIAVGQGNDNVAFPADGPLGTANENQHADENLLQAGAQNAGNRWWGIFKEIWIIIFGFITSLLPGFENLD